MARLRKVRVGHEASYADPIEVAKGDRLTLSGDEDLWDGHRWIWAAAAGGKEGWVPDDLIVDLGDGPIAARDYSAIELTCESGEAVEVIHETHGWAWCRRHDGREGWVPLSCLSES